MHVKREEHIFIPFNVSVDEMLGPEANFFKWLGEHLAKTGRRVTEKWWAGWEQGGVLLFYEEKTSLYTSVAHVDNYMLYIFHTPH